jgi:hypothetical protein
VLDCALRERNGRFIITIHSPASTAPCPLSLIETGIQFDLSQPQKAKTAGLGGRKLT